MVAYTFNAVLLASLLCLLSLAVGSDVHDPARGFKTHNLPEEEVDAYLKQHDPNTIINKHANKEDIKEHPEIQRFLEWQEKHKAGHASAGAAFAGKLPHDFIPHMTQHKHEDPEPKLEL
mmetsp:Transcript_22837/g.50039  ORF Transcript_22837/g.50039 Transcript_22837/m.50039 type:complete len:119 (-) Transcript_22837:523-879(-)|eukprot:CAMPEP_0202907158 /NCGR_PEP_ID=MMETSP1392-20130828/41577_1 /ASSEMBLY_ACC=CAM_ASM_000868 /TAXON_ID=225041 /ORGANISM="Chlamydomonas chlamydogama, Strain SAG 11-48b" /LENGTH=118 /DNA_ID=CAMNT_0049595947 /DNA_START=77 /DNA_END=433 /DNA_ORIENTATION=+